MMQRTNKMTLQFLGLGVAALSVACGEEEVSTPTPTAGGEKVAAGRHVLAVVGEGDSAASYLAPAEAWDSGRLTFLGEGTELGSYVEAIAHGPFIYAQDYDSSRFQQMRPTADGGYEIVAELVLTPLTDTAYFRTTRMLDDTTLFLQSWPNPNGKVDYVFVNVPGLTVRDRGSYVMEPVDTRYMPVEVGSPVVVGDKIYLGTMYWVEESGEFHTSLHTLVMDYPSMSNPRRFSSTRSVGSTGGFAAQSMFQDEEGFIYQHNIRSKFWYNMGTAEEKPTIIHRIRGGELEYDETYEFDVSAQFSERVSLILLTYVGNGIAFGAMLWEDRATDWGEAYSQNRGFVARFDLRNKTVTAMNVPDSPVLTTGVPLVKDGLFHMPIAPVGGEARIMIMDPQGGADGFKSGLGLDGNGLQITSLLETTAQ